MSSQSVVSEETSTSPATQVDLPIAPENAGTVDIATASDTYYQELATNWRYFLDWRHRIMERVFVTSAGLMVAAAWLANASVHSLLFAPFMISGILFHVVALLDARNAHVITCTERRAAAIEIAALPDGGFFAHYPARGGRVRSYTEVLRMLYRTGTVLFLIVAIYFFIRFRSWEALMAIT